MVRMLGPRWKGWMLMSEICECGWKVMGVDCLLHDTSLAVGFCFCTGRFSMLDSYVDDEVDDLFCLCMYLM
jgi:hypothetical protein